MTNYEKHKSWFDRYQKQLISGACFGVTKDDEPALCAELSCDECKCCRAEGFGMCSYETAKWLDAEVKEVDWSKVPVDTPIYVRNYESVSWLPRHFAKYEHGRVYAWDSGKTSFTNDDAIDWAYAKLANQEADNE